MTYIDEYRDAEHHDLVHTAVVVARGDNWDEGAYTQLRQSLPSHVLLIFLSGDEQLELLDEDQMRRAGWVRATTADETTTATDEPTID